MNGRINISVPREVHTAARVHCIERGKTMAQLVAEALRRLLADEQRKTATPTA
jgi:predicted HicB family RNase H-like nuclease